MADDDYITIPIHTTCSPDILPDCDADQSYTEQNKSAPNSLGKLLEEVYEPIIRRSLKHSWILHLTEGGGKHTPEEIESWKDRADKRRVFWADQRDLHADNPFMQLHYENDNSECAGCDFSGYEGEPPTWPCRTVALTCMGDPDFYFGD